jgi:hypothetical protein
MDTQTRIHPHNARGQVLKCADQRQALDLAAKNNLDGAIKTNEVKHIVADINANGECLWFRSSRICPGMLLPLLTGTVLAD